MSQRRVYGCGDRQLVGEAVEVWRPSGHGVGKIRRRKRHITMNVEWIAISMAVHKASVQPGMPALN
ncbi:MAG: hypothetical protein OXC72_14000 [Roseovarius sp.]|nr:hypothetical protein [Roseovarius sp.]